MSDAFNLDQHPKWKPQSPPVAGDGGGGHDGGMERVAALEAKFEAVVPTLATKADLAELRGDMQEMNSNISRWTLATVITVIGTVVLGFAGLGLTTFNALKPAPAQQAQAQPPIIINVPAPPAPATPAPPAKP